VVAKVRAYVMPVTVTYKIWLYRQWSKRIEGVEHHAMNTLIIQGINGILRRMKGRLSPSAELEIVQMKERSSNTRHGLRNNDTGDDDESAEDAVDTLLHELDD
jgi:hypothetical protein